MAISKENNPPACSIRIGTHEIRQVESFIYLGTLINQDGRCDNEILRRIAMAKDAYSKMLKLFKNHKISLETKKRLLKCYIRSILLYGSECWTISTKMRERLEAAEMWFYRRILRISYTQHVTNERVLERMSAERELIKTIRVQQMKFFGHIMRNKEVESMIITAREDWRQKKSRKAKTDVHQELEQLDRHQRSGTDKSGTGPTAMESHNLRSLEQTWNLKKKMLFIFKKIFLIVLSLSRPYSRIFY